MLIHVGYDNCVDDKELIAVLSKDGMSAETSAFMDNMKREGRFAPCPQGERSYLLLSGAKGDRVEASCIRSVTLKERFDLWNS